MDGEFGEPSVCYSECSKESTEIISTLHFPPSNTQGCVCKLGKEPVLQGNALLQAKNFNVRGVIGVCPEFKSYSLSLLVRSTKIPMVQMLIIVSNVPLLFQN